MEPRMVEEREVGEDYERGQQQAFYDAYADLQVALPTLHKSSQGHGYRYAALNDILSALRPVLAQHGFVVRWRTWSPTSDSFGVRCVLRHKAGWYETSEIIARASEVGGRMSGAQQRGALQTYLERYTLLAVLGTAPDVDTDAAGPPVEAQYGHQEQRLPQGATQGTPPANATPGTYSELSGGVDGSGIPF